VESNVRTAKKEIRRAATTFWRFEWVKNSVTGGTKSLKNKPAS